MQDALQLLILMLGGLMLGSWLHTEQGWSVWWIMVLPIVGLALGLLSSYKRLAYGRGPREREDTTMLPDTSTSSVRHQSDPGVSPTEAGLLGGGLAAWAADTAQDEEADDDQDLIDGFLSFLGLDSSESQEASDTADASDSGDSGDSGDGGGGGDD